MYATKNFVHPSVYQSITSLSVSWGFSEHFLINKCHLGVLLYLLLKDYSYNDRFREYINNG